MTTTVRISLTDAAELLGMAKPNVAAFLSRRGVERDLAGRYERPKVEAALAAYEAEGRRESDQKRRETMRGRRRPSKPRATPDPAVSRTGETQALVLLRLAGYPVDEPAPNALRLARLRLVERGLVEAVGEGRSRTFEISTEGRRVARVLARQRGVTKR